MNIFKGKNHILPYFLQLKVLCTELTQRLPLWNFFKFYEKLSGKSNTTSNEKSNIKKLKILSRILNKPFNNLMDLKNKNVVYVGGFGGIGIEVCKKLLSNGTANLVILEINLNEKYLQQLQNDFPNANIIHIYTDITNKQNIENSFKEIIKKIKYIDILVNGSGVVGEKYPDLLINVNLLGLINTCLIAIPYMDKSLNGRGGLLVNISSVLGLVPCAPYSVYSASKFGVIGFTRSIADEHYYKKTGISVIAICPGKTDTPLIDNSPEKGTFPYSNEIIVKFMSGKIQSAEICAMNIIEAIKTNKNGSVWIVDLGKLEEVQLPSLWEPKY